MADKARRHGADLDLAVILIPTLKHWYAYQMVYPWALFFVKASILALYHRIFEGTKFRRIVYGVTGFVTVYTIVVFFVNVRLNTNKSLEKALAVHPVPLDEYSTRRLTMAGVRMPERS